MIIDDRPDEQGDRDRRMRRNGRMGERQRVLAILERYQGRCVKHDSSYAMLAEMVREIEEG